MGSRGARYARARSDASAERSKHRGGDAPDGPARRRAGARGWVWVFASATPGPQLAHGLGLEEERACEVKWMALLHDSGIWLVGVIVDVRKASGEGARSFHAEQAVLRWE